MEYDADWDVDSYRTKFECEEHWQLRKEFMDFHIGKFPEEKVVCLAQVYVNIEILRCKYPSEVMQLVKELSSDIGHEFRERRKGLLKRTFVSASDAANAKFSGAKKLKTK